MPGNGRESQARGTAEAEASWSWNPGTFGVLALVALGAGVAGVGGLAWGAERDGEARADRTRLEAYAAALGARADSLGERTDAWLAAGRRALDSPVPVTLPFREADRRSPEEPAALAYRLRLRQGQVLEAKVEATAEAATDGGPDVKYFVELFRLPPDTAGQPAFVAEAGARRSPLVHEARSGGVYVLRVMPEPFRGVRYTVDLGVRAAFPFPVADRGPGSVISRYGAPRDGGRRSHEGVDVYAPAGTPVLAVSRALVYDVGTSELGGNYVWLQDWTRRREIYYAHLAESWVEEGMVVEPGHPIGTVGNTGNASATAPHLHFGVYDLDREPSDPLPYIAPPGALPGARSDEEE